MEGTARTLQGCVFDVKSLLTPIRKAGRFDGILAGYFLAGQLSIGGSLPHDGGEARQEVADVDSRVVRKSGSASSVV